MSLLQKEKILAIGMATFSNEHAYNPYGAIHPEAHYQGYHGNTNPAQSSGSVTITGAPNS